MSCRCFARGIIANRCGSFRLKIFFDVGVGEATIGQMDAQLRGRNGATRKKRADRSEDDLMLRFDEIIWMQGIHEPLAFFARDDLIAQRA